jgi:hypothetical protein
MELRFHDLRHSYATWLVSDGVPVNDVAKVVGHEQTSTTLNRYTHSTHDLDSQVLRLVAALSQPPGLVMLPGGTKALRMEGLDLLVELVGVAGIEPTASSSRTRSNGLADMGRRLYLLLRRLVVVGLLLPGWLRTARSSPRVLPGEAHAARRGRGLPRREVAGGSGPSTRLRWARSRDPTPALDLLARQLQVVLATETASLGYGFCGRRVPHAGLALADPM